MENSRIFTNRYIKNFVREAGLLGLILTQRWDLIAAWAQIATETIARENGHEGTVCCGPDNYRMR